MEFQTVVDRRRMVRNYDTERPVPPEVRDRLLRNAVHAPSAGFSQGWAFMVLEEPGDRQQFWDATTHDGEPDNWLLGLQRAPMLILCFSHKDAYLDRYAESDKGWTDKDEAHWSAPYWDIDTGMAALLILLTAVDEELGACFFGVPAHKVDAVKDQFGVPAAYHPVGVVSVGYRAKDKLSPSLKRGRKEAPSVVHHGRWNPALEG